MHVCVLLRLSQLHLQSAASLSPISKLALCASLISLANFMVSFASALATALASALLPKSNSNRRFSFSNRIRNELLLLSLHLADAAHLFTQQQSYFVDSFRSKAAKSQSLSCFRSWAQLNRRTRLASASKLRLACSASRSQICRSLAFSLNHFVAAAEIASSFLASDSLAVHFRCVHCADLDLRFASSEVALLSALLCSWIKPVASHS